MSRPPSFSTSGSVNGGSGAVGGVRFEGYSNLPSSRRFTPGSRKKASIAFT
ncbi:MAG: hypothetical protein H7A50_07650 [Akkermansiaceae bacterium]|nr:hypothetical protein [Akkermansiaceae bacterium]